MAVARVQACTEAVGEEGVDTRGIRAVGQVQFGDWLLEVGERKELLSRFLT